MATSMPSKVLRKFTVEEKSFSRISYFMPRVRSIFTRMENILNFEFNNSERGIKRMRSDDVELEALKTLVEKKLNVVAMSSDEKLLEGLTEKDLVINRQTSKSTKPPENCSVCSSSILQESVVVVITREQNLEQCLKLLGAPDWLDILVICSDLEETNMRRLENVVKENFKTFDTERCLVLIKPTERNNLSTEPNSDDYCSSKQKRKLSSQNVSLLPSTSHLASIHESCTRDPSSVRLLRAHAADDNVAMVTPPTSPKQRASLSHNPPLSVPRSNSSPTSPTKTRPSSPSAVPESKRTKRSFDKSAQPTRSKNTDSPQSMDVDADKEQMVYHDKHSHSTMPVIERTAERCEGFDFDNEQLKKAVSFRFETMTVDIISRILKLLRSVRDRRDQNAKVASVTTLDKIIYEVEGLLSQSITDIGMRMKQDIEEQQLSRNLADDLLSVDGVYGCGTLFDRLCIHIEAEEEGHRDKIKKDIDTITLRHQYTKGFSIQVVKSKPKDFRRELVGLA